ncbi:hypothetical protein [Nocardia aurantiaca]|uniref:Uncharacterized protein n=1 Tax=Nocardia aurantiaca TaxID=2675850 RepID=A0A6I3L5S3_9NOCA|nr:hypothetical protein [Nocardia aurantiaca]MTE15816.1 hypothetical protein [Nocardia aurantiaca]
MTDALEITTFSLSSGIGEATAPHHHRSAGHPVSAVARAIGFAIARPPEVDVSEIIVRPTAQR